MKIILTLLCLFLAEGCAVTKVTRPDGATILKITGPLMRSTNTDWRDQWLDPKTGFLHEEYLKDVVEGDTAAQVQVMLEAFKMGQMAGAAPVGGLVP